jgi:hypothetical protein
VTLDLPFDAVLPLHDAQGLRIACLGGAIWVTQESDYSDTIVEQGGTFEVNRAGKTLVVALRDSRVSLLGPTSVRLSLICT